MIAGMVLPLPRAVVAQALQRPLHRVVVARLLQLFKPRQLPFGRRVVDVEDLDRIVVFLDEVVDADDDLLAPLDRLLELIRRLGDLLLRVAELDRLDHAAHAVDGVPVLQRAGFHLTGELLDEVRPAERVDDVRHAAFVGDDLLRAERDRRRLFRRQRQRLVERVGVERIGAAEHGGQRLQCGTDDVVVRLLRGQ